MFDKPGTGPITMLQHQFYATLIYKHCYDWLKILSSQSEWLKN